jgi:hypothetical protein
VVRACNFCVKPSPAWGHLKTCCLISRQIVCLNFYMSSCAQCLTSVYALCACCGCSSLCILMGPMGLDSHGERLVSVCFTQRWLLFNHPAGHINRVQNTRPFPTMRKSLVTVFYLHSLSCKTHSFPMMRKSMVTVSYLHSLSLVACGTRTEEVVPADSFFCCAEEASC